MQIINGTPAFRNDCPKCQFVGRIAWNPDFSGPGFTVGRKESPDSNGPFGADLPQAADLYNCYDHHGHSNGNRGAVLRYGNQPDESISTFEIGRCAHLASDLAEALELAFVAGAR